MHRVEDDLLRQLTDDPYTSTVVRRLFGIAGVIPTQAFLRELVALELGPADEPHVERLVRSLNTVVDAHVEIIEALRRATGRARGGAPSRSAR